MSTPAHKKTMNARTFGAWLGPQRGRGTTKKWKYGRNQNTFQLQYFV